MVRQVAKGWGRQVALALASVMRLGHTAGTGCACNISGGCQQRSPARCRRRGSGRGTARKGACGQLIRMRRCHMRTLAPMSRARLACGPRPACPPNKPARTGPAHHKHGAQDAVGLVAVGLAGGGAVEGPLGELGGVHAAPGLRRGGEGRERAQEVSSEASRQRRSRCPQLAFSCMLHSSAAQLPGRSGS